MRYEIWYDGIKQTELDAETRKDAKRAWARLMGASEDGAPSGLDPAKLKARPCGGHDEDNDNA